MARLQSLRDKPNTAREYETIYILRPNTPNEGVAEVNTRIKGVIEGMGGKVIKVDNWGKRRLAYEVAKERKGIYLYWQYLAQPGVVEETERNLRMLDSVIRYLTVKVDEDVDVGARPTEIDDTSFEKAAQTAADEEDLFLSRGTEDAPSDDDDEFGGDEFEDVPALDASIPREPREPREEKE
jgi:small subunit ribosomal protein S6